MLSLFSGFLVKFSKQWIGHILTNKIKYEKLYTHSFHDLWSWKNKLTLLLSVLAYFLRYGHFMDFTPIQQQKPILQCIFQNFDREREFCKNLPLFLILRAYLNHRIYKESILWCVKNQYFWHSTIGKYWQWVIKTNKKLEFDSEDQVFF